MNKYKIVFYICNKDRYYTFVHAESSTQAKQAFIQCYSSESWSYGEVEKIVSVRKC